MRHNAECEYRMFPPPRRRKKPDRSEILHTRLERYGRILYQKDLDLDVLSNPPNRSASSFAADGKGGSLVTKDISSMQLPSPTTVQSSDDIPSAQLLYDQNRSKYLDRYVYLDAYCILLTTI